LGDLRDVAKEISIMIGDQGQDIKQIDTNVSSTNEHVNRAVGETEKVIIAIILFICSALLNYNRGSRPPNTKLLHARR
jgi:t-SNARE complex subunit (syntaxin)